jgi:hypothetical protein
LPDASQRAKIRAKIQHLAAHMTKSEGVHHAH